MVVHPQLLVHPADHHALVHALVRPADKVAVQVHIHIVDVLHQGEGLIDKDVIHIEGVLGQLQLAVPQNPGAVDDRVHQQILGGLEVPDVLPVEHPAHGEHIAVAHHPLGVVLHVLIDVVGDHQVHQLAVPDKLPQLVQHLMQGVHIQPVIGVHHLIVDALGIADALVHPLAVAAVGLVDGPDDIGVFFCVPVTDGRGVVLGGAVIHQNDFDVVPALEQGLHAVVHIGR